MVPLQLRVKFYQVIRHAAPLDTSAQPRHAVCTNILNKEFLDEMTSAQEQAELSKNEFMKIFKRNVTGKVEEIYSDLSESGDIVKIYKGMYKYFKQTKYPEEADKKLLQLSNKNHGFETTHEAEHDIDKLAHLASLIITAGKEAFMENMKRRALKNIIPQPKYRRSK